MHAELEESESTRPPSQGLGPDFDSKTFPALTHSSSSSSVASSNGSYTCTDPNGSASRALDLDDDSSLDFMNTDTAQLHLTERTEHVH